MRSAASESDSDDHPHDSTIVPDDPRLLPIVREFAERLDRGEHPNLEEYVARCPEIGESIRACLEGVKLVHRSSPSGSFREAVAWQSVVTPGAEPLGDFRIIRELGRGGMGIVYEALQISLNRRVALKVLPFAATMNPRQLQRFSNEAQAAALLHHPHIVPVFAVGCDRGVHYYAMQLIEGTSLADLLADLRHDAGIAESASAITASAATGKAAGADKPRTYHAPETMAAFSAQLTTERSSGRSEYFRTIARFGLQAAEALAYAHEAGVVHRDVKPGNLLVDGRGKLWVTDFGLAQVRSGGELTQTGDLLGTLRYMSPEQLQGDRTVLDQRTDVYSLGATLYELATLRPMFVAESRGALLNRVLHEEPPAPRMLNREIPPELDTIILKAISKSPHDRYGAAQDLADDLRRFLANQPIRARRPTPVDHVRKWTRRHPITSISLGIALLATSIGLSIHNRIIALEQARTQARAIEAERNFQQAREAVDLLIHIGEEELAEKPHMQLFRKRLLNAALEYYQDFIAHRGGNPTSKQDLAAVEQRVQKILKELAIVDGLFRVMPAMEPDVQADLGVTDEQRRQLQQFRARMESERDELFATKDFSGEERQHRFVDFAKIQATRLDAILSTPQQERLREIFLQCQGLFAFQEPEVISRLQLTTDQQRQIREIETDAFLPRPPGVERRGPPPRDGKFAQVKGEKRGGEKRAGEKQGPRPDRSPHDPKGAKEQKMREAVEKVVAQLTQEQADRWQKMIGVPFEGDCGFFPRDFPGGPPQFGPPPDHGHPR